MEKKIVQSIYIGSNQKTIRPVVNPSAARLTQSLK